MGDQLNHSGIFYSVSDLGGGRWKWKTFPPDCVRGLDSEQGEVAGVHADAVKAAQKAIERQMARIISKGL
jgi:hypothetical protein